MKRTATVIAGAAVIGLVGAGGAVAGSQIGSGQIKNQSIRQWDIGPNEVGLSELNKYAENKIDRAGENLDGYEVVGRGADAVTVPAGESARVETLCASTDSSDEQQAERALGGGANVSGGQAVLVSSFPSAIEQVQLPDDGDPAGRWVAGGWTVEVRNTGAEPVTVQPYVLCANVG